MTSLAADSTSDARDELRVPAEGPPPRSRSTFAHTLNAAAVTIVAILLAAASTGASAAAQGSVAAGYGFESVFDVPATTPTLPVDPVNITIDAIRREVLLLENEPPSVIVMTPEGSILRRFGIDVLRAPADLVVINAPSTHQSGSAERRVLVTEPSLGSIHVFNLAGEHVARVTADWQPGQIVEVRDPEERARALVIDQRTARVVPIDWDGAALPDDAPLAVDALLVRPTLIAGAGEPYSVFDLATYRLIWFDGTGTVVRQLALDTLVDRVELGVPSALVVDELRALISTDRGMWAFGWPRGSDGTSPIARRIDVPGMGEAFTAMDLLVAPNYSRFPMYRRHEIYALGSEEPVVVRLISTQVSLWFEASIDSPMHRGCPMVWERPDHAWRVLVEPSGAVRVLMTNGLLHRSIGSGFRSSPPELGYLDDLDVLPDGRIVGLAGGVPVVFVPVPSGVTSIGANWEPSLDCLVAGIGPRPSIALGPPDADGERMILATQFAPANGHWHNRLGASFDVTAHGLVRGDAAPDVGHELLQYSHQSIGAPILSDVALELSGRRAAIVDRLGGRILVFDPHAAVDWEAADRWLVPGRPERIAWASDGHLFVLTADGWVWRLDEGGRVTAGWDAAGQTPSPRPTLVDIAVGSDGRVLVLDKYGRRLVAFVSSHERVDDRAPQLPPPCRVQADATVWPARVAAGSTVTATLGIAGGCGSASAKNDILILMQPPEEETVWTADVFRAAVGAFVDGLDATDDRVSLAVFDATGRVLVSLGSDFAAVRQAAADVAVMRSEYAMASRPLRDALEMLATMGRADATPIVVLVTTGTFHRSGVIDRLVVDGETLREHGVRVVVVASQLSNALLPALLSFHVDDLFIALDATTLRAVHEQLGREFGARVLARELRVTAEISEAFDYDPASASPSATWDPVSRRLRWSVRDVGFGGWTGALRLRPRVIGHQPVFAHASADVIDGFGNAFEAPFPIPWLSVLAPPTPTPTATVTQEPTPTARPTSSLTPHVVHLPIALVVAPQIPRNQQASLDD